MVIVYFLSLRVSGKSVGGGPIDTLTPCGDAAMLLFSSCSKMGSLAAVGLGDRRSLGTGYCGVDPAGRCRGGELGLIA